MKIVADENIPFAREAFCTLGEVTLAPGRTLTTEQVVDAELLAVRSVTQVNGDLLDGTHVCFVGSATAGIDHIDLNSLVTRGIGFTSAPGSNALSVGEYMAAAWLTLAVRKSVRLDGRRVGIIGVGHTGSRVEQKARALGMIPVLNDPPLARTTGDPKYRPIEELFECDIITCHTPLTHEGLDATFHLANAAFFERLKPGAWFCNAGRGEVVDSAVLSAAIDRRHLGAVVLDVWEGEPRIDAALLQQVDIATPHVAGYSYDGKVRGTAMIYQAACRFFKKTPTWDMHAALPPPAIDRIECDAAGRSDEEVLYEIVSRVYSIERDDGELRETATQTPDERAKVFDQLRKEYPIRREWPTVHVRIKGASKTLREKAKRLGFQFEE